MLFSNSPVKNIVEKLNPFSQKNKISRLKFERKGDYKTFLKFIKDSTKEIEDIKISGSEDKKRKGLMIGGGILGLGLLGFAARGKRDSDDGTGKLQSISGVIQKAKADSGKAISSGKKIKKIDQGSDVLDKTRSEKLGDIEQRKNRIKIKKKYMKRVRKIKDYLKIREQRNIKKKYANKAFKFSNAQNILNQEVGGDTNINKKSTTKTRAKITPSGDPLNIEQRQFADRNRLGLRDDIENFQKIDLGAEEQIKEAKKIKLQDKLKIKSDIRVDRQEKANRASNVLDDLEAESKRRAAIEDAEIKKTKSKIDKNKFFEAPEIPSNKTKKLTQFDKFNRFSNRVLNSPVGKFTTFMGGLLASPKVEIIKQLFTATPLADGTLEGKPGVFNPAEQLIFNEDAAVNIFNFSEGRESMIPFSADVQLPSVSTPTEIQTGSNKIVVDYEFNTTEDLFFIKMAGS